MDAFILVEEHMLPVPTDIRVVEDYDEETIVDTDDGKPLATGHVMFLSGPTSAFVRWLKPFDGVWQSQHPLSGNWKVFHIRDDASEE